MIQEWLWARSAKAAPLARRLGYVREQLRQKACWLRNVQTWLPHLEKSRTFIRNTIQQCHGNDLAVVAGSGACLDIPLEELSATFKRVLLVDLVHPREVVLLAEKLGNVRLCLNDLTGTLPAVAGALNGGDRLSLESMGRVDLEALSKELPELKHADFVISANTLAQLPLIPMEHLWTTGLYTDCELEAFASNMIDGHIAWLRSFTCPSVLITDLFWISLSQGIAQTSSPLYAANLGIPQERWEWHIAPKPEAHPDRDILHIVGAFCFPPQAR
ncbi:MAG: hypothetical protein FD177_2095 [Desulfovibrionaceae bacterium]|nr:MAG: hypothetical protein FD177_2095 [Desulfovibrionaceae bacterium]